MRVAWGTALGLFICFLSLGAQVFQPKTGVRTAASEVHQSDLVMVYSTLKRGSIK